MTQQPDGESIDALGLLKNDREYPWNAQTRNGQFSTLALQQPTTHILGLKGIIDLYNWFRLAIDT